MIPANTPAMDTGYYGDPQKPLAVITAKCHPWLVEKLQEAYYVAYLPAITYAELLAVAPKVAGIIITTRLRIDATWIDTAPNLQWIGRLGSGLELIDVAYAQAKGIKVVSSPEGNAGAVGEHALGLILAVLNKIAWSYTQVREAQWLRDENRGTELQGCTVGIIGYGHTGSALAKLLQPFGVTVLAYDKYKFGFAQGYIKEASLEQVQRYADIISLHVPLTSETRHMVHQTFFQQLQKQPVIINTSRGGVINLNDLKTAYETGQISGAGLDVLENEKLISYTEAEKTLLQWLSFQPNIIITPHIAGYSHQAFLKMAQIVFQKLFG